MIRVTFLCLTLSVILVGGCAINPVTGRPEPVVTTEAGEIEQGREAAKVVKEQMGLVEEPRLSAYVDAVGQRLAQHSPRQNLEHHFHVVDMSAPNAFALPGGYVYVSRGLLVVANSEDELANTIGHEIGHIAARHSVERQVRSVPFIPVKIVTGLGGFAVGIVSPALGKVVSGVGQLPGALILANYSRGQEQEADRLGQQLAAESGWDPAGMASFMETLAREDELTGGDPSRVDFFASHPPSPERAKDSHAFAKTLSRAEAHPVAPSHEQFLRKLEGLVVGEPASEGVFVENRFLHSGLDFALTFPADWETFNAREFVAARSPDEKRFAVLRIAGEGDGPLETARAFEKKHGLKDGPQALRIGSLAAAQGVTTSRGLGENATALLTWVAHGGSIYQIAGVSPSEHFAQDSSAYDAMGRSFHPLTAAERAEIRENRLQIVKARSGETLEQLLQRVGSVWKPEEAAVANGIEVDAPLRGGVLIKVAIPEPYHRQ